MAQEVGEWGAGYGATRRVRPGALIAVAGIGVVLAGTALAQEPSPRQRVDGMGLDSMRAGLATVHFDSADRERAAELLDLAGRATRFYGDQLGLDFEVGVVALGPERWFSPYPGQPYAIPWSDQPGRLLFVQASLHEGLLIEGTPDRLGRRRVVDYTLLHEYGHLAAKRYLRAESDLEYLPVSWFEELLANYFAYAFVRSTDAGWARFCREGWRRQVEAYTPAVVSLDWSYMNDLAPPDVARDYSWYQNLINSRTATLYEEHGLDLLRVLRRDLPWSESDRWTTETLLPRLEAVAPGFEAWTSDLLAGYRPSGDTPPEP